MFRHLARVGAALADATGSTAPAWSPSATLADWLARRNTSSFSALGTVTRRHDYFLRVMPLVDHRDPRTLPLYEAYADSCDRVHWEHVEQAALALAMSPRATGETLLSAATRRFFTGDLPGCRAVAEQAFAALQSADARDAAWFAAGLVARTSAIGDPLAARAWLTTTRALTPPDNKVAQLGIAVELAAACEATGDELGRRRASEDVDRIRLSVEPERVADLVDECSRPVDSSVAHSYGSAGLDAVAALIGESEFEDAYARFSEEIGGLVETMSIDDVLVCLRRSLEHARAAANLALDDERVPLAATIASWLCAAIVDLLVDPARDDEWEATLRLQFQLEDDSAALPEVLFAEHDGDLAPLEALIEAGAPAAQLAHAYRSICAVAGVPHCLAEAERALAEGRARRARVWTERAAELRDRF